MNLFQLAIILTSTISSSSAASTAPAAPILLDNRIECKIEPINDPALTNVFAGFDDNGKTDKFRAKYDEIVAILNKKKASAIDELKRANLGIEEIAAEDAFSEYNFNHYIVSLGYNAIATAKNEWNLRSEVLSFLFNTGMMIVSAIGGKIKMLEDGSATVLSDFTQNCPTKSLTKCYEPNPSLLARHVALVKKWAIAQEMFSSVKPSAVYLKAGWKPLLSQINVPVSRFAVAPIKKDLNMVSIWKLNGKVTQTAITTLRKNLKSIKDGIPASEAELTADFALRESVMNAVFKTNDEVTTIDSDVINRRVKAFERIAEGVVRGLQSGTQLIEADVNKAIKAYLMSVQMFVQRGFDQDPIVAEFATLAVPSGISITRIDSQAGTVAAQEVPAAVTTATETVEPASPAPSDGLAATLAIKASNKGGRSNSIASTDTTTESVGSNDPIGNITGKGSMVTEKKPWYMKIFGL